jgi:hypothetical protein
MPRKSAEAQAGAWFQAQQRYGKSGRPKPPSWLHADAAKTFREIVGCRAPDLFGPGSLELLAHFCFIHHHAIKLWSLVADLEPTSVEARALGKMALAMAALEASLAGKCALRAARRPARRCRQRPALAGAGSVLMVSVTVKGIPDLLREFSVCLTHQLSL